MGQGTRVGMQCKVLQGYAKCSAHSPCVDGIAITPEVGA